MRRAVFERIGDDAGVARSLRHIAAAYWGRCRVELTEPPLERALEHAQRAGDERELSEIRQLLIWCAAIGPLPVDAAIARCDVLISDSGRDPLTEAVAANALSLLNAMGGRFSEARELSARSRGILEDLGLALMLPTLDGWAGQVEVLAGDPVAAERVWRRAYQALEGLGEKGNLSTIAAYLAEAVYQQGRYEEAARADGGLGEHDVPRRCHLADLLAHGAREGGRRGRATSISLMTLRRGRGRASSSDGLAAPARRRSGGAGRGAAGQR